MKAMCGEGSEPRRALHTPRVATCQRLLGRDSYDRYQHDRVPHAAALGDGADGGGCEAGHEGAGCGNEGGRVGQDNGRRDRAEMVAEEARGARAACAVRLQLYTVVSPRRAEGGRA